MKMFILAALLALTAVSGVGRLAVGTGRLLHCLLLQSAAGSDPLAAADNNYRRPNWESEFPTQSAPLCAAPPQDIPQPIFFSEMRPHPLAVIGSPDGTGTGTVCVSPPPVSQNWTATKRTTLRSPAGSLRWGFFSCGNPRSAGAFGSVASIQSFDPYYP